MAINSQQRAGLAATAVMFAAALLAGGCMSNVKKGSGSDALIRYEYAPGELTRLCDEAMNTVKARLDAIGKVSADGRSADTTLLAFERATSEFSDMSTPLTFMAYVSTDEATHKEAEACEEKINRFSVEIMSRRDLYEAMKDVKTRDAAEARLHHETMKDFEKNGLKLSDEKRQQVSKLKQDLAELESKFSTNINNDVTNVEFTAEELAGVPATVLERMKKTPEGRYATPVNEVTYIQVMENAPSEVARKRMIEAYYNRAAKANVPLLEKAILLRQQVAKLMGYDTWADYRTTDRMAKSGKHVLDFLHGLQGKLSKRNHQDIERMLKFKRETLDPHAKHVELWDVRFLENGLRKRDFNLDKEKIREYFPADLVVQGMFDVYSRLLGVRLVEDKGAKVWHSDVKLYRIENAADGALIGHFYADFFPREKKYSHAAAFTLIGGRKLPSGEYSKPVSAIVANFNPPAGGKPSLLGHDEVETIFHEFGHIMHQTLTKAPFMSLSGSSTQRDFVEAPSQMLENWVWSPEILASLSGHYQDRAKKLPADMLKKMIEARDFNKGYFYMRQLYLGLMDMTYHTAKGPVDTTAVADHLQKEVMGIAPVKGGHFQASFGHLMGGYDAGYYGYLWSEVYAEDMFTEFEKHGLLDPVTGMKYRKSILERGNTVDSIELVRDFLGREPNNQAFFHRLHIK